MKRIALVVVALALAGCETTVTSTWEKPGLGPLNFHKIVVLAPISNAGMRRSVEDQIARQLGATTAIPGYQLVDQLNGMDKNDLRTLLQGQGFDGAVVVRVASVDKQVNVVPPGPDYYGWGAWPMYDPGYVSVDTFVNVVTSIYSVPTGELLFTATSRTANPGTLNELVDETVNAVLHQMKKQGLTPQTPVSAR